ncbi:MAG: helix-turn-helix domain-containing protein [Alphaproteobacteria bacterium]|nr:helix-turn-helix domain-containing protein [Alphaproteobacteria bacterium]
MCDFEAIGKNIVRLRAERKLSQEDLCGMVEMDRSYLSEIENGHKNFSVGILFKVAKALNVKPEEILKTE